MLNKLNITGRLVKSQFLKESILKKCELTDRFYEMTFSILDTQDEHPYTFEFETMTIVTHMSTAHYMLRLFDDLPIAGYLVVETYTKEIVLPLQALYPYHRLKRADEYLIFYDENEMAYKLRHYMVNHYNIKLDLDEIQNALKGVKLSWK
ncbi:MAG TPA: hypothetical protein ENO30_02195 [Thermodesulfobium narugense]|nr:hypothetical protein [Thermodesulfobium narugense]